ncbi:hypothetical protein ACHAXT_012031 [Thalassiosira profunda]
MSRLTFDEIMDFIIEADKERVDLLFRRPGKDKLTGPHAAKPPAHNPMSPMGLGGLGSNSNSVKWIDEKSDAGGKLTEDVREPERESRREKARGRKARDDPSVDEDAYNDGGTVESQSQYTMETYEEESRKSSGRGKGRSRKGDRRKGRSSRRRDRDRERESRRRADPVESGGFLDLLIDTLCTSVMGRDARDMCADPDDGNYDDEDDDFSMDDETYRDDDDTYDRSRRDEETLATEDERTFATEDDGTRTLESKDVSAARQQRIKERLRREKKEELQLQHHEPADHHAPDGANDHAPFQHLPSAPDPPTKGLSPPPEPAAHRAEPEAGGASAGIALPLQELEYDDRVDYAADVSVMESLGGPSLLVERARHENAAHTGADRASFEDLDRRDPELSELVVRHGGGFAPDAGLTREETAFRDPYKFYEHAVASLLRENEPEKVRLLGKLMAKYRGRERHLIHKLGARYDKEREAGAAAGQGGGPAVASGADAAENLGHKPSTSGMEKIHEGGEDEEQGSSVLNDPSRANMEAIEAAKKKMEGGTTGEEGGVAAPKDEEWPEWGAGGQAPADEGAGAGAGPANAETEENDASRPADDEGSYSDGSSYSGDESDGLDGTSPAIIAQVSELLNYVYGKTSVAGQIDRVSTIMRAYEGREAVLLELLETKALIKANADSNRDAGDLPPSLRNSPGLTNHNHPPAVAEGKGGEATGKETAAGASSEKKLTPPTPVSVLTAPTMANGPASPASAASSKDRATLSPSAATMDTANTTASKKKKKGLFGGFFGGKKKDKVKGGGTFPTAEGGRKKAAGGGGKKGAQPLDDRSI